MRHTAIPKLSKLPSASAAELLALWTAINPTAPPGPLRASRELLAGVLAWQLQERKFGGLKPTITRRLRVLARAHQRKATPIALAGWSGTLRPGTVLIRQWRGAPHVIMALADGFQYQGKVYGSLSRVAREITGTHWNGPAFFGLRKKDRAAAEVHKP
jgi:Protein of unknown function (DUF2924)